MALGFTPVALEQINAAFARIFAEELSKIGGNLMPVVQSNLLLPYREQQCDQSLQTLLETLSRVHPGRFFLVREESAGQGIKAAISASCHTIAANQYFCSEVIELRVPTREIRAVSSIILAHAVSGVPLELLLCPLAAGKVSFEKLLPLADRILFDSGEMDDERLVRQLMVEGREIFDFQWLRLSPWRRAIKLLFDHPQALTAMGGLEEITVVSTAAGEERLYQPGLLLAGWLLDRLRLDVVGIEEQSIRWRSPNGREGELHLQLHPGPHGLISLAFRFHGQNGGALIEHSDADSLSVTMAGTAGFSVEAKKQSLAELAEQYYGDALSGVTYNKSLRKALTLRQINSLDYISFS